MREILYVIKKKDKVLPCLKFLRSFVAIFKYQAYLTFTCLFLWGVSNLNASANGIATTKTISEIGLTQLTLDNGMSVWLKPTDFEGDSIYIKLAAIDGFASLPSADRYSGEFSPKIAWESGMGGMSSDQVSVLLYENSLDFVPKIQAFSRTIEGTSGKYGLEAFLKCIKMVFTEQSFTTQGLKAAEAKEKNILSKTASDYDQVYEAAFLQVNTQGLRALQPMNVGDLKNVNFEVAKQFFTKCFSDPSAFVCVMVGSFELDKAKDLVVKYLGAIPKSKEPIEFKKRTLKSFPDAITVKEIHLSKRSDALTRLTFPLTISVDEKSIYDVAFLTQIIEARLRHVITQQMKLSYGVDVSYEFPYYPLLNNPWISIRFRSDVDLVEPLRRLIIAELKKLVEQGAAENEIVEIKQLEEGSEAFWLHDNFYWVSMLANYYFWNWDKWYFLRPGMAKGITLDTVNKMLKTSFTLNNYSVVTAKP